MKDLINLLFESSLLLTMSLIVVLFIVVLLVDRVLFPIILLILEKAKSYFKITVLILGIITASLVIAKPVNAQSKSPITIKMSKGKKKQSCVQRIKARRKADKDREKFYKRKYGLSPKERRRLMS